MKRLSILILSIALLGCAPVTGAGTAPLQNDPNIQLAIAGAQLTGTAQAFEMQVVGWTVTAQSWTSTPSPVPTATMTPSITPTPTVNVTQTMVMANANAELTKISLQTEGEVVTNNAKAWLPYFIAFLSVCLAGFLAFVGAKRLSMMPTPVHSETGRAVPMINVLDGVAWDSDRMANGMSIVKQEYVKVLPAITGERQDLVNSLVLAKLPKRLPEPTATSMPEAPKQLTAGSDAGGLFPLPDWSLVNGWQGEKSLLPYGLTSSGLGFVDVGRFPHLATIGATGEGKSRRFFRPLITCALAAGHRVVIVGKTADYFVFDGHPNVTLVRVAQITKPEQAERYVQILNALVDEMNRRDDYLTSARKSTWAQAGRENTWLVLDEIANVIRLMSRVGRAGEVVMAVEGLVSEGRKVGFNVLISNQRATGMAGILSQTGKAVFRVERDEEKAHKSLEGASALRSGYFLAKFGAVHLTGAFEPSDDEIAAFLGSRPVPELDRDWVDGKVVQAFIEPTPQAPLIAPKTDLEALAEAYLSQWQPGMSGQAIGRMIGKPYGGSWKEKIDQLREVFDRLSGQHQISEGVV